VACMKQQLVKLRGAGNPWCWAVSKIIDVSFKIPPSIPGRWLPSGDASNGEVAREWVQTAQVQAWLARVLEDLGGEHPVG